MRWRCQRVIDDLDVPPPYGIDAMIAAAQLHHGRRIGLLRRPGRGGLTGFLLDHGGYVHVCVDPNLQGPLLRHVVAHELGHLLLGHRLADTADGYAGLEAELLDPPGDGDDGAHAVGVLAGREHYDHEVEYEAELFATLMLGGSGPPATPPPPFTYVDTRSRAERVLTSAVVAIGGA